MNGKSAVEQNTYYASYVLLLLWLAYILSFIDRQILSLLIAPIREDFAISDTQFSLLHGLAFAIFYTLLGLPIGRMADSRNRRNIIVAGVALWSVMTCLCGMAKSFSSLFIARIGVGVGEAALSPPAHSLLTDYFKADRLPLVFAFYTTGIIVGSGIAYLIGGELYQFFEQTPMVNIPLLSDLALNYPALNDIKPWQATFIAVGLPGLLMALLMLTIKEPKRNGLNLETDNNVMAATNTTTQAMPLKEVFSYLNERRKAYFSIIIGVSLLSILGYATMAWYPEFLRRSYGMEIAEAGSRFGSLFLTAGLIGTALLAFTCYFFARRGVKDISMRVVIFVACAEFIPATLAPLMPNADLALLLASVVIALQFGYFGIAISALQIITPNQLRAQVSALLLFATNILGLVIGPTIVALLTDYVFVGDQYLNRSLALTSAVIAPLAAIILWRGLSAYRQLVEPA